MSARRGAPASNEVIVTPGRCVTWGCGNPAWPGPECAVCAVLGDGLPPEPARDRRADNARARARRKTDPAWAEAERKRKREYMRRRRLETPGYCPGRNRGA